MQLAADDQYFTNEFEFSNVPDRLILWNLSWNSNYGNGRHNFPFKIASLTAMELSRQMKEPIASTAGLLVSVETISLPHTVTLSLKLGLGSPKEITVAIERLEAIDRTDTLYAEAMLKYLNRRIDLILAARDFEQNGREFFEKRTKDLTKYYSIQRGVWMSSRLKNGWTLVVDPRTQVKSKLNLLEALNQEVERRGLKHWHDLDEKEINRVFKAKAYNLRSTYQVPRRDDLEYKPYRFVSFDLKKPLKEDANDHSNPVDFHRGFDRNFSMDQPEVIVLARGGRRERHIPELLQEQPSLHMLKRFGVSDRAQAQSLLNATDRYYETVQLAQPLLKAGLVHQIPCVVIGEEFGPVMITLESDYLEVKSNIDFQKYFNKHRVLAKPDISTIHLFSRPNHANGARTLLDAIVKVFAEFRLLLPRSCEHLNGPEDLKGFVNYVVEGSKAESFSLKDLALIIFPLEDEDSEDQAYISTKRESLKRLFPVQFVDSATLERANSHENHEDVGTNIDLKKDLANPLFIQIVAKTRGQPYGLQQGFMPEGTIIFGVDRYLNPFQENAPLVTTVVLFDSGGSYVCGISSIATANDVGSPLRPLVRACLDKLFTKTGRKLWNIALFFVDSGPGTILDAMLEEARECAKGTDGYAKEFAFITANSSSHMRLYMGNPSDDLSARKSSSFAAAIDMKCETEFLVVSTEPIISREKAREYGTPRPILYEVFKKSNEPSIADVKRDAAKAVVWLCRHSWVSPTSTRLPAPLYFANKLSRLVAATGIRMSPDPLEAPLFL